MIAIEWSAAMMLRVAGGAIGLSVLCSAWVMWRSGLAPRVLNILGIIAGVCIPLSAMFIAPAFDTVRTTLEISVFIFFIWMMWAGVLLWIRTPKHTTVAVEGRSAPASYPPDIVRGR